MRAACWAAYSGDPAVGRIEGQITVLINELLQGPEGSGLYPPLPSGVEVAGVHLLADGVAYIDLTPPEDAGALSWGSKREILAVYSLVDSASTAVVGAFRRLRGRPVATPSAVAGGK